MIIKFKYEKIEKLEGSKNVKGASKVIVLQDDVELSLNKYYYILEGVFYYSSSEGWPIEVASSESEFKEYILDKVLI